MNAHACSDREAAEMAIDGARHATKLGADEAIDLWRGLAAGRWSLVDRYDTAGRRFLVVKRRDPKSAGADALTADERDVVGRAALGQSNKLIAYELGLCQSTVGSRLKTAARKLGYQTCVELVHAIAWSARRSCPW